MLHLHLFGLRCIGPRLVRRSSSGSSVCPERLSFSIVSFSNARHVSLLLHRRTSTFARQATCARSLVRVDSYTFHALVTPSFRFVSHPTSSLFLSTSIVDEGSFLHPFGSVHGASKVCATRVRTTKCPLRRSTRSQRSKRPTVSLSTHPRIACGKGGLSKEREEGSDRTRQATGSRSPIPFPQTISIRDRDEWGRYRWIDVPFLPVVHVQVGHVPRSASPLVPSC